MAIKIYLGYPPAKIREWIENNAIISDEPLSFRNDGAEATKIKFGLYSDLINNFIDIQSDMEQPSLEYAVKEMDDPSIVPTFSPYTINEEITLNPGNVVCFRATDNGNSNISYRNNAGEGGAPRYYKFDIKDSNVVAGGNIQTLLNKTGKKTDIPTMCFASLFANCTGLYDSYGVILPTSGLSNGCFIYMFDGCTKLY
jgi:hypothetical protein